MWQNIAAAMPKAQTVFDELARQLSDRPFFASDVLNLADVLLAPQLDLLQETPE
jgi:glutathione S-transferase